MTSKDLRVLLITPPMVQLNTPYPATPVLAAFLKDRGVRVNQLDFSLEVALEIFTDSTAAKARLAREAIKQTSANDCKEPYRQSALDFDFNLADVISFLQGKSSESAWRFSRLETFPQSPSFELLDPSAEGDPWETLDRIFGVQGIADKAKLLCSLFLDDFAEEVRKYLDPSFRLSKYADHLAVAAPSFSPILERLSSSPSFVDSIIEILVGKALAEYHPTHIGLTMPFPGTVYGAFKIASVVRSLAPEVKIIIGGGYVNSELRELGDIRVFDYVDYICYDEGFDPILGALGLGPAVRLRTKDTISKPLVQPQSTQTTQCMVRPLDYSDLDLSRYISFLESLNPMQRLWSDGHWIKLQLASGCYWHKCRFCDVALDYIGAYHMPDAVQAVDVIERLVRETGVRAFHFTDEAIPPRLMQGLCAELINRKTGIVWWGNIRLDKVINSETANLMAESGCIAVSAGLECAVDRLLKLMRKGIDCATAYATCKSLSEAGIMVHTYLMYGYPSQSLKETKQALSFVRDLFRDGLIQSAYWHRFALTVHSPLACDPPKGLHPIIPSAPKEGRFALNEIQFKEDIPTAASDEIGEALRLATYNFALGLGLDKPISFWFRTTN